MTEPIIHYGVKGMRWGVRRTDAQLARASSSQQEKAQKFVDKRQAKDEAWAQKQISKGKGEQKANRMRQWGVTEQAQQGLKRRDAQYKKIVAKQMDKDPSMKKLTPQQKEYYKDKAAKQILIRNVAEKQIKTRAVDTAVREALKRGGEEKLLDTFGSQNEVLIRIGVGVSKTIVTNKLTKQNTQAINEMVQASLVTRRERRLKVLETELKKNRS